MLCMHRALLAGTQKRLHKPHSGDYITWNTGHVENSNPAAGNGAMPLMGNTQIGSASLQGVRKGLLNQG